MTGRSFVIKFGQSVNSCFVNIEGFVVEMFFDKACVFGEIGVGDGVEDGG